VIIPLKPPPKKVSDSIFWDSLCWVPSSDRETMCSAGAVNFGFINV
jgi:hypothetical protein